MSFVPYLVTVGSSILASYTQENHWLEYFCRYKSRHKSILAATRICSSIMKFIMPCLCVLYAEPLVSLSGLRILKQCLEEGAISCCKSYPTDFAVCIC